jgi:Na+/H+-translocating membrane pyrophosphatase
VNELIVVLAVCVSSLAWAGNRALSLRRGSANGRELERLLSAVDRAGGDFLSQEARRLGGLLLILGVSLGLVCKLGNADAPPERAIWLGFAAVVGAGSSLIVAHVAQWAAARATARALEGLRKNLDDAATAAFRGAALVASFADTASVLVTVVVVLGRYLYLMQGGSLDAAAALGEAVRCLPAAALGAVAGAAVFQVGGSSYQTAARAATSALRDRNAERDQDEDHNPALVAELVGNSVGGAVCRSTDVFSALVLINCVIGSVAAALGASDAAQGIGLLALFGLPLMVRATGSFATLITFGTCRFEGQLTLPSIFVVARGSHALMAATGLFGASFWLVGEPHFWVYAGTGSLGIGASVLSSGWLFLQARHLVQGESRVITSPREVPSVARALGLGLQRTWPPLLLVGACLGAAHVLGARSELEHGALLSLLIAVIALLGAGAFNLSEGLFFDIAESVALISKVGRGGFDAAARGRAEELSRSALVIGNLGQTQGILGASAAALLGAISLPLIVARGVNPTDSVGIHPIVLLGALLGAGSVLFYVGRLLETSSRAAQLLDADLRERRPSSVPGSDEARVSSSSLPSYRISVDLAAEAAAKPLLSLGLVVLAIPFCIGILLRLAYGPSGSSLAAHALAALGTLAALTGGAAALAAQGTRLALESAPPAGGHSDSFAAGNSAREFVGHCVGPAALLGLKAAVVSSLAAAPLLF